MNARYAYMKGIWSARYFWLHLAFSDIRVKYRRSVLGIAWAIIQPLALTLLLSFMMTHILHAAGQDYVPFIFSGLVIWEFITTSAITGCTAIINAEGYIKQLSHPLAIYTLRCVIPCMINLLFSFIGLIFWCTIMNPNHFGLSWLALPFSFVLLFFFGWPLAAITSFVGVKFRDFSQLIIILLQVIYYISPILFLPKMFIEAHIEFLLYYNPIYHVLNLFRMPLLQNQTPTLHNYLFVSLSCLFLWISAWLLIKHNEKNIIFHL